MTYHETVPSELESGVYQSGIGELYYSANEKWFIDCNGCRRDYNGWLFGTFPQSESAALSLACEVAFARMEVARSSLLMAMRTVDASRVRELVNARERFLGNERSLSLLRDMERVTGELTKEAA